MEYLIPKPKLFLGVPLSEDIVRYLDQLSQDVYKTYFDSDSSYLHIRKIDQKKYLGKEIDGKITLEQLTLLELNIISILKKALPDYVVPKGALKLLGF